MRYALALATLFLGFCHAQTDIAGIPKCAGACITGSFGTCGGYDAQCICTNDQVIADLACCVSVSCGQDDQDTTLQFAQGICDSYDANLPSSATCAPGAQSTPAGASTGTAAGTSSMAASSSSSMAMTTAGGAASSASASASSSAASVASESSASVSAAAQTGNAAARNDGVESGLGLGLAFAGLIAAI